MSERERRGVASSHSRKDSKLLRRQRGCSRVFFWNTLFTSSSFAASFIALLEVQETKRATRWWKSRTEKERFQQEGVGRKEGKKKASLKCISRSRPRSLLLPGSLSLSSPAERQEAMFFPRL
jgi:hypothetical protein